MDSIPVNWEALDSLIIDFVKSENLIEDSVSPSTSPSTSLSPSSSTSSSSSSSSSYQSRLLIRQIRRSVECGDIDAAIDLLRVHASFVLDDHRLLFCLQKQVTRWLSPGLNFGSTVNQFSLFWTFKYHSFSNSPIRFS